MFWERSKAQFAVTKCGSLEMNDAEGEQQPGYKFFFEFYRLDVYHTLPHRTVLPATTIYTIEW